MNKQYSHLKEQFFNSKMYKEIHKQYSNIYSEYEDFLLEGVVHNIKDTPGQHLHELHNNGIFFTAPFFYLQLLRGNHIADVGCGINFVKNYIPGITGYDTTPQADYQERFNDDFVAKHKDEFDSAFAINSLHYISLSDFVERVHNFCKIVVPKGQVFVAFNVARMIERTPDEIKLEYFNTLDPSQGQLSKFFDNQAAKIQHKIICYHNTLLSVKHKNDSVCKLTETSYNNCKGSDWPEYKYYIKNNYQNCSHAIIEEIKEFTHTNLRILSAFEIRNDSVAGNVRLVLERI